MITKLSPRAPSQPTGTAAGTPPALIKITLGVLLAIIVAMVTCSQANTPAGSAAGPPPAEVLPEGFPIPAGAQVINGDVAGPGGVVTLRVPDDPESVVSFYAERLPESGWTLEEWNGTDPFGDSTKGFVLTREDENGALSVKANDDGTSQVQVNMNQPVSPSEGGGHGMGGKGEEPKGG
jgi:hypothetical protein